ncbi:MAG: amidohydrolase family protein [bacterium]|nr:amidohydrolase family protein [bacterium]
MAGRQTLIWTLLALALGARLEAAPGSETPAAAPQPAATIVFEKVNVVGTRPGQKKLRRKQTVVVEDGRIVTVGKSKKVEIPEGATVIDGRKKYLLPGLADMHVHLSFLETLPENMTVEDAYTLLLANGVTSIYEMWGFDSLFAWRRQLERGAVLGPRLFFASPAIRDDRVSGTAGAESAVRSYVDTGYEAIKVHTPIDRATYRRVHEVARELGVPVVGHAARPGIEFSETLDQGTRMLAHVEELLWVEDPQSIAEIDVAIAAVADNVAALAESETWLATTVVVQDVFTKTANDETFAQQLASPLLSYFPASLRSAWENDNPNRGTGAPLSVFQKVLDSHVAAVGEMKRLAATDRLLVGTDGGGPDLVLLGFSIHDEMALLVRAGLSPREVIRAATYSPAVFLGLEDVSGSVETGKQADLLLIDANPLKKISRLKRSAGTMVRGTWLGAAELQARLDELAERFR